MRPDIDELLGAVRWTIEEALLPEVSGPYARFQAMIALDLLDLIHRHWATAIADLTADIHGFHRALEVCQTDSALPLDAGLRSALSAALAEPLPAQPAAYQELTARAGRLAELVERLLAQLDQADPARGSPAQAALRAAVDGQLARVNQRQAGLDIRR